MTIVTPGYMPNDQERHLGEPPWAEGPELDAWEAAHGHDPRLKCIVEYGCMAIEAALEYWEGRAQRAEVEARSALQQAEVLLRRLTEATERATQAEAQLVQLAGRRLPPVGPMWTTPPEQQYVIGEVTDGRA